MGVSRDYPNFWITGTPIILRTDEATNFNFCMHNHTLWDQLEQKPINNFVKSSRGRTLGLSKIFRAPKSCESCGHLRGSSAFLLTTRYVSFTATATVRVRESPSSFRALPVTYLYFMRVLDKINILHYG